MAASVEDCNGCDRSAELVLDAVACACGRKRDGVRPRLELRSLPTSEGTAYDGMRSGKDSSSSVGACPSPPSPLPGALLTLPASPSLGLPTLACCSGDALSTPVPLVRVEAAARGLAKEKAEEPERRVDGCTYPEMRTLLPGVLGGRTASLAARCAAARFLSCSSKQSWHMVRHGALFCTSSPQRCSGVRFLSVCWIIFWRCETMNS
mmetsp:Transcript_120/g.455  ORF Transcript_120/g.455 Transcript_120/m.455 type:complete len:207 (+) Transcript_120:701-1321(+)